MKVKIEIVGQIKEDNLSQLRLDVDVLLKNFFKSFKFNWELIRGLEK